jgi:hypothetical protein
MQMAGLILSRYRRHMPALMVLLLLRAQFVGGEQPELEILEPVNASVVCACTRVLACFEIFPFI